MSDKGQTDSHTAQVHTAQPAAQTTDPLVLSLANEHVESLGIHSSVTSSA